MHNKRYTQKLFQVNFDSLNLPAQPKVTIDPSVFNKVLAQLPPLTSKSMSAADAMKPEDAKILDDFKNSYDKNTLRDQINNIKIQLTGEGDPFVRIHLNAKLKVLQDQLTMELFGR